MVAAIMEFSGKPECEIEKVEPMDELPDNRTYPLIQPWLIERYMEKRVEGTLRYGWDEK